jgi:hypothetical protein
MSKLAALNRRRALTLAVVALAVAAPAAALAAHPIASAHYSGRGTDCYNNTASGRYTSCAGKTKMSFGVSSTGRSVIHFKGYYTYYCGAGKTYVTDKKMRVASNGSFHTAGKYASYGPGGKRNGTIHAFIKGQFIDHGHKADVTYRAADYFSATPHARPCGTQVSGVVTAH